MTHILIASTGLTEQPLGINGRTVHLRTNFLLELAPIAVALGGIEPDDVVAALADSRIAFQRLQPTETLGAVAQSAGDLGGGATPGGSIAPPVLTVDLDQLPADAPVSDESEGLTLAQQGITGPANALPPVEIAGETAPLVAPASFPADVAETHQQQSREPEPSLLDQSVPKLIEALEGIDNIDLIDALIVDETAGKTRTGALAALNARKGAIQAIIDQQG